MAKMPPKASRSTRMIMRNLSEEQDRQRSKSAFTGTGMHPTANNGIESDDFDGDLVAGNAGTKGWSMNSLRAAFGELILRPGSIGNDSLTNPVYAAAVYDYTSNFAIPTTLTNIRTMTVGIPDGFTKAAVTLTVRVYGINNTAGIDYLYSQANINGYNGLALPVVATGSNGSCMNVSTFSAVLEGPSLGSSLVLQIAAQTQFSGWAADPSNVADLSASISWYR